MVPSMVDRLWRAESMIFLGIVTLVFHSPTLAQSRISHLIMSSRAHCKFGHLSGPGALPGFRQYSTYFAIS